MLKKSQRVFIMALLFQKENNLRNGVSVVLICLSQTCFVLKVLMDGNMLICVFLGSVFIGIVFYTHSSCVGKVTRYKSFFHRL